MGFFEDILSEKAAETVEAKVAYAAKVAKELALKEAQAKIDKENADAIYEVVKDLHGKEIQGHTVFVTKKSADSYGHEITIEQDYFVPKYRYDPTGLNLEVSCKESKIRVYSYRKHPLIGSEISGDAEGTIEDILAFIKTEVKKYL
jgi:hypothetical protein